jgi:hypothetical protein
MVILGKLFEMLDKWRDVIHEKVLLSGCGNLASMDASIVNGLWLSAK